MATSLPFVHQQFEYNVHNIDSFLKCTKCAPMTLKNCKSLYIQDPRQPLDVAQLQFKTHKTPQAL